MNREHWHTKMTSSLTRPNIVNFSGPSDSTKEERQNSYSDKLESALEKIANNCSHIWNNRAQLDSQLIKGVFEIEHCCHIYAINSQGIQISSSISCSTKKPDGGLERYRAQRPYIRQISPGNNFLLSLAYINQKSGKLAVTATHTVYSSNGALLGYIGVEFEVDQLPHSASIYDEPNQWKQLKGDPAIRGNLFSQTRIESAMDRDLAVVMQQVETLILHHGVFQINLHFSSNRTTVWFAASPHKYRLLDTDMLTQQNLSLNYPVSEYPKDSKIKESQIAKILEIFHELRMSDDVIYLRSASINIFNGLTSLTFSCDGTHYLPHTDLLNRDHNFWKK
ncbi:MAG: hypothetical protein GQ470_00405 [Gammaproteobacteria bacterium]|nr:hypothetical protein [Gammaproteobacteria bacterium]